MMLCDLSSDREATGSSSHGGVGDLGFSSHVLLSPLFAPAATPTSTLLPRPPLPMLLEEPARAKRKRSQPGNPDPGAEVIALSPRTLVATNRFVCEICNKGFQRDQNLQLHRRGHNLPWKLRQRTVLLPRPGGDGSGSGAPRKRVYVCPEPTCVHHDPARALGDLTGIKKHFSRKHGEKRWKCERCAKRYAVHSDWKAHVKNCGTREYRCDCGILFSRKDSLLTHRAFCDALAEESARLIAAANNSIATTTTCNNNGNNNSGSSSNDINNMLMPSNSSPLFLPFSSPPHAQNPNPLMFLSQEPHHQHHQVLPPFQPLTYLDDLPMTTGSSSTVSTDTVSFRLTPEGSVTMHAGGRHLTRDFLGVDNAGEVEELQMSVPLCAAAYQGRSIGPTAACCATDLTRQYLGRLPPVNEPWSHNF
ncbi:protein EARLY HEADING DATE 2-like [Triticum urartu]|uniref:C2H2-type domain-containing protein n=1 Tax=Triticum urartu TaxID=4572 RepID=A0A8R7QLH9_TRIUA|nr:protein EARLY HEADING DATE 2-like [Triticum urartu]